jgi:phosphate transport system substrate-binding protein
MNRRPKEAEVTISRKRPASLALLAAGALGLAACDGTGTAEGEYAGLSGTVAGDGSSTVYPLTEAVAEEFGGVTAGNVRVTIAYSGTGGGFRRFCTGDTDLSNASRHISESERELCAANGVEFVELPIALDGMAVVVNHANDLVRCLSVDELRRVFEPGSTVQSWAQVRAGWPDERLRLYAPGTASGTFDYFTEAIMGRAGASRADFTASEDDNVLVQGIAGDRWALGYFGYAYYEENAARLKLLDIDGGNGCVTPTPDAIRAGEYTPLSRPLFIYVNRASLQRAEVASFIRFYVNEVAGLAREVGYVPLSDAQYAETRGRLDEAQGVRAGS